MGRLFFPALVISAVLASVILSGWRLRHQVAEVRATFETGDLIVVEPPYIVGPRQRLGDLPLVEPKTLSPDDLVGFSRVLLLHLDVIGAKDGYRRLLTELGSLEAEQHWGLIGLTIYRLTNPAKILFDMRAEVPRLKVSVRDGDGTEAACDKFDRDRWVCPRDPGWSYVGRETLDIDGEPRECVWMHPMPAGGVLQVELPAITGAASRVLVGGYGFAREAAERVHAPVQVEITHSHERVFSGAHQPGVGFERFRAPFSSGDGPIDIAVTTNDNGASHFCMALKVVEAMP